MVPYLADLVDLVLVLFEVMVSRCYHLHLERQGEPEHSHAQINVLHCVRGALHGSTIHLATVVRYRLRPIRLESDLSVATHPILPVLDPRENEQFRSSHQRQDGIAV